MSRRSTILPRWTALGAALALCAGLAHAQTPAAPVAAPPPSADLNSAAALSWLDGCWTGTVNQRDFREQWSPLRGGTLLGVGSTVLQGKLQSYEFLRIEGRGDGVYYVAAPSGQPEAAFKLVSITTDDKDTIFTFANPAHDFPQRILYRRATEGWLYATIEGKLKGEDRQVIYPMRHVGCESGEFIRK
ncbi:MAG: DUF6265 family protein [Betaproteobacteria bacterium]